MFKPLSHFKSPLPDPMEDPRFYFENIRFLPVFHGCLEFAHQTRQRILSDPPEVIAVEYPGSWRETIEKAVNRLPFLSIILGENVDSKLFLPIEPTDALVETLRTAKELGIPVEFIDLDVDQYPAHSESLPDSYATQTLGYEPFMQALQDHCEFAAHPLDDLRETMMAHALQELGAMEKSILCVLGAAHLPGVREKLNQPQPRPMGRVKQRTLRLCNWSAKSSREFMSEAPFLAAAYEKARKQTGAVVCVDRLQESEAVIEQAQHQHREHYREDVTPAQLRTLGIFAKKYALAEGRLAPDLFQLVTAARGVVNDDFGYETWELGSYYPWQDQSGLLPSVDLDDEFATLGGRKMVLRRKIKRQHPRFHSFANKHRLRERFSGRWKSQWSGRYICSHQPEDLAVENFGRYLQKKAQGMFAAEHNRIEPFSVSLKDGLDVRETLRNWHTGLLYIQEKAVFRGNVGSVIVIFDEDHGTGNATERYPWLVTWLGEHEQESDMALYASPAGEELAGPGISRCHYGGFVMSYPPQRMFDIWSDPYFHAARNKAERLLMAGLDYAQERNVLYVAEKPPREWFHTLAGRMGKKLIYLPLGQLNPTTLATLRIFHVLDGHNVREYAADYIKVT